ncbi:hypothetical protein JTB14_026708 [Gonioctena quinquepunctata]|nr:hypothetical protein JTB14_026708 [Gonioctena quinquepunctata]
MRIIKIYPRFVFYEDLLSLQPIRQHRNPCSARNGEGNFQRSPALDKEQKRTASGAIGHGTGSTRTPHVLTPIKTADGPTDGSGAWLAARAFVSLFTKTEMLYITRVSIFLLDLLRAITSFIVMVVSDFMNYINSLARNFHELEHLVFGGNI